MTAGPPYTVRYLIDADGAIDAVRLVQAGMLLKITVAIAIVGVLGLVGAVTGVVDIGFLVAVWAGVTLVMVRFSPLARWQWRRRARGLAGKITEMTFDEDGIRAMTPLWNGVVAWSGLTGVRADDRTMIFVSDRILSAYVPTHAFRSPAERDAVLAYSQQRIAETRRPGPA